MKWKTFIKEQGIKNTAKKLNLSYEAVRQWIAGQSHPSKKHIKKLIELSKNRLKYEDFF